MIATYANFRSLGLQNTSKIQNEFLAVSAKAGEKKSSLKNSKKRKQDENEDSADDLQDSEVKDVTKPSKVKITCFNNCTVKCFEEFVTYNILLCSHCVVNRNCSLECKCIRL